MTRFLDRERLMTGAMCFEGGIPQRVEDDLNRLYGTPHSSLRNLHLSADAGEVSTYIRSEDGVAAAVLLYRIENRTVHVLNYQMDLAHGEINAFADFIFERCPTVGKIEFPALSVDVSQVARPRYARIFRHDVVIDPAPDAQSYQKLLGKSVRKGLRTQHNRMAREFPDFAMRFHDENDFIEAEVREIIAMSRSRIEGLSESWQYSPRQVEDMIAALRQGGLICVATIGGRVCGGLIVHRFADSYACAVCAYAPALNSRSLGFYVYYLGVAEILRRGARRVNLGYMVYDYKLWLGGKARRLERVAVYRSWARWLADGPVNIADLCRSSSREVMAHARLASHRKHRLGQALRLLRTMLRRVKRVGGLSGADS